MKIPTVDLPSVESRALGTPFQQYNTKGAFGGGDGLRALGAGIGSTVEGVDKALKQKDANEKKEQDDTDVAAIAAAEAAYDQHVNQTLYDPERGFLTTKGGSSLGARPDTLKSLQERRKEIEDGLGNDKQKDIFRRRSTSTYIGAERTVDVHSSHQSDALKNLAFKAVEQKTLDSIQLGDEENFEIKSASLREWAMVEAKRQGYANTPEGQAAASSLVQGAQGKAVAARLDGLLSPRKDATTGESAVDIKTARDFYAKHSSSLGVRADEYGKKIEAEGIKADATLGATQYFNRSKQLPEGKVSRWAEPETALATFEMEVPDSNPAKPLMREQLQHRLAADEQLQTKMARKHAANANAAYERGGMAAVAYEDLKYLGDSSNGKPAVDFLQDLKDRARRDGDRWAAKMKEKSAKPTPDTADQTTAKVDMLKDMIENPSSYGDFDAATLRTKAAARGISDSGMREINEKLLDIAKGAASGDPAASLGTDVDAYLFSSMKRNMPSLGGKTKKADMDKKGKTPLGNNYSEVFAAAQEKLKDLKAENRKGSIKTTPEDFRKAADDALAAVRVEKPWLFGLATKTVKTSKADAEKSGLSWEPIVPESTSAKPSADMADSISLDEARDAAAKKPAAAKTAPVVPASRGSFNDVPEKDRIQIVEAMQAKNKQLRESKKPEIAITPAAILNYYNLARR